MIDVSDQSTKRQRVTRTSVNWLLACASCSVLLVLLSGCHRPDTLTTHDGFISPLTPADITYEELFLRYNAAIDEVDTLWSRADIDIEWVEVDDDGDRRYRSESGNGKFIMRRCHIFPELEFAFHEIAMTVEKLGKVYLWAGSNARSYYLFDRVDGDNKTLYLGQYYHLHLEDRERKTKPFPLPIHPNSVPKLLGLEHLPGGLHPEPGTTIDRYGDQYLLNLPEQNLRMLIDPQTFRPTRVDLTDRSGYSVLTAKLSGQLKVDSDKPLDSPLLLCEKAEVYVAGYESRFTLDFQSATTSTRKIKDQMFDLEALKKALNPDRVIDLDK